MARTSLKGNGISVMAAAFIPNFEAADFFDLVAGIESQEKALDLIGNNGVPVVDHEKRIIYTGCKETAQVLRDLGCIQTSDHRVHLSM